ncbi:MAG TPA: transglycosylase domain-containing protein [Streptosporangiaceae bacterium]|nr:transglycosylase domain-containing protein [Streptosporangiaceae bacterium]
MSNPDLPGSYWDQQDDNGSGWRSNGNGSSHNVSPWDNGGAQFWRDESRGSNGSDRGSRGRDNARSGRSARGMAGANGAAASGRRSRGSDNGWATGDESPRRGYRGSRRAGSAGGHRNRISDSTAWFSQTAEDLKNRLGMRGSVMSRGRRGRSADGALAAEAGGIWDDPGLAREAGGQSNGRYAAAQNGRNGARHATSAGRGDYGYGSNGRTALHDPSDGYWDDEPGATRGLRSRIAERTRAIPWRGPGGPSGPGGPGGRGGGWDGGPGGRFRRSLATGSWWRHWTLKKVLGLIGGGIAALILLSVIGFFIIYQMTPIPTDVSEAANFQSSSVYFSNGTLLGTFSNSGQSRQLLSTTQIPQVMNNAMIAAEDRNFYHEGGISITGIFRAGYQDIFGSGGLQGGSTITEEYAKNYYSNVGFSRSLTTKLKEIFIAIKLAHKESKPWILTQYLNTVDFGRGAIGVGAASEAYFGKNLAAPHQTLTVPQAAMLAAMPNEPSVFNPDPKSSGFAPLVARWQYVLVNMVRDNAISQQEATSLCAYCASGGSQAQKAFSKAVKTVQEGQNTGWNGPRYYLMNMVEAELEQKYGLSLKDIETKGLKIVTTFKPKMITALNSAVKAELTHMKQLGQKLPNFAHVGATLIDPKTGGILAIYGGPGPNVLSAKQCKKVGCWNNSAEVPHQPGSSFKAYVLSTAVSQNMDVQGSVLNGNSPICVPPDWTATTRKALSKQMPVSRCTSFSSTSAGQGYWYATDTSLGGIPPAEAAAVSSNPAFEDLAHRVGIDNIIKMAGSLGVGSTNYFNQGGPAGNNDLQNLKKTFSNSRSQQNGSVTMALGASGADLTSIEQASTFATLANDGTANTPHVIQSVSKGGKNLPSKVRTTHPLSSTQAADIDYALSFDNTSTYASVGATGFPSAAWDRPVIAKTGTTDCAQSAWFIGAIPQYSLAVTLYTNQQNATLVKGSCPANAQSLNMLPRLPGQYDTGGFGGAWPATIWHQFMTTTFNNLEVQQLPPPNFGPPFVKWNQVPKQNKCGGQNQNGNGHGHGFFQNCNPNCPPNAGPFCNPNPNPTPTCSQGGFFGGCNPSTTPSCNPAGQKCVSTSPPVSPSPTPSPSITAGVTTTAVLLPSAEPPEPSVAALLRLRAVRRELSGRLA